MCENKQVRQKENIHILPIKPVEQTNGYECGLSSVMTILKALGVKPSKAKLKEMLGTNSKAGTSPDRIKALFDGLDVTYEEKYGSNLKEIEKMLKTSKMCLVAYQAWGNEKEYAKLLSGHYSVIFGFENEYLWLADPAVHKENARYGKGLRKIKKETFLARWKDVDFAGKVYERWMLGV